MTDEKKNYGSGTICDCEERVCDCKEKACDCGKSESKCDCGAEQRYGSDINEEELQEIYHDAMLGKVSVEILRPLSKDRTFRDMLTKQYVGYDNIAKKTEDYAEVRNVQLKDPTGFSKGMMYCTTMMNTVKDKSNSKLAEIMIQGINMGIISLTKISNKLKNEGKSNAFVDEMSDLLQEYLTQTKTFL